MPPLQNKEFALPFESKVVELGCSVQHVVAILLTTGRGGSALPSLFTIGRREAMGNASTE